MVWTDEFAWSAVEKSMERSLTGAALIDIGVKQAGRPVTLEAQGDAGWMPRADVLALVALVEADPGAVLTFTHADGRTFDVQFAPVEAPVTAEPIPGARPELPPDTFPYVATVRLITV
ncbi:hypothetical protein DBA29_17265 [Xenophilus aerolatus]|nr:hypothetical protein [Xenophilus aerolatus]